MASKTMYEPGSRVEVSGWDIGEEFFVEKGVLFFGGDGIQRIILQAWLRVGSLVFVRSSDGGSASRSVPVTFRVASISENSAPAGWEIFLRQVHPPHIADP